MMQTVTKKIIFGLYFCAGSLLFVHAQPSLKATVDKNEILIGEQIKLKVTAVLPKQDFFIRWIELPDTLAHFEVVTKSNIDSSFTNQKLTGLSQTIVVTSFDSGKFTLPSFNASFTPPANDTSFNLATDSFTIAVNYLADTTNVIRDIKTIKEVKDEIPLWYWFAGAAALIILAIIIIWLIKKAKKPGKVAAAHSAQSAYERAVAELEQLRKLDISSPVTIKQYHSLLADILKEYLSSVQGIYYGSSTTSELLLLFNQKKFDRTSLSRIAGALRCSDAVKFAKYLPARDESEESLQMIMQAVNFIEQQRNNNKNDTV